MTSMDPDQNIGWYNDETGQWDLGAPSALSTEVDAEALGQEIAPASLPYAGTSGWSGSEASRERAEFNDSTGRTALLQTQVERAVTAWGPRGMTVKEVREAFPERHHGSLSSALTDLHKDGRLLRLTEKRDRCSVYISPRFLLGREAVPPKRREKVFEVGLTSDMDAEFVGHLVIAALNGREKITVRGPA